MILYLGKEGFLYSDELWVLNDEFNKEIFNNECSIFINIILHNYNGIKILKSKQKPMKKLILVTLISLFSNLIFAQSKDQLAVANVVESLRKAMEDGNRAVLDANTHPNLTYGHSNMKLENKTEYVEAIASGNNNFSSITLSDQTIKISGKTAIVRHKFVADYTNNGQAGKANIAVIQVYQKIGKKWLLLARQAVKI